MTKGAADGFRGNQYAKEVNAQSGDLPKQRTIDKIAAEHSIGANTVQRAEKFAKGVVEMWSNFSSCGQFCGQRKSEQIKSEQFYNKRPHK